MLFWHRGGSRASGGGKGMGEASTRDQNNGPTVVHRCNESRGFKEERSTISQQKESALLRNMLILSCATKGQSGRKSNDRLVFRLIPRWSLYISCLMVLRSGAEMLPLIPTHSSFNNFTSAVLLHHEYMYV